MLELMTESPKRVLITGGTGSIGQSLVREFAGQGHHVAFTFASQRSQAEALSSETGSEYFQLEGEENLGSLPNEIDVLVNNAGINISRCCTIDVQRVAWDETIFTNLTVPFLLCRRVLPHMLQKQWGRFINISSIYGFRSSEGNLPYTVSKHGLRALTTTIAREYASFGITSNEIAPCAVESDLLRRVARQESAGTPESIEAYLRACVDEIPALRLAEPADVASAAIFLSSETASFINGITLPVDGGLTT